MTKYILSISFDTSRELTEDELKKLQHDCIAQIEEPTNQDGGDVDFDIRFNGSDIDQAEAK